VHFAALGWKEIALASGEQTLDAMARIHFQRVAADNALRGSPLPNGECRGQDVVGRTEMGADSAALRAEPF